MRDGSNPRDTFFERMKILFVLEQRGYLPTYAGVARALTRGGHSLRLAWPDDDVSVPEELAECPGVTIAQWPKKREDEWASVVTTVRRASDYLRYLSPDFQGATKLRARAFQKLLHSISRGARIPEAGWSDIALGLTNQERERLLTIVRLVEDAIPSDTGQEAFLNVDRPDAVLVSPLIDLGSSQTDVVKSAKRLGIPTGMILYSWDNLSTKGGLHEQPDRMFVWNERQRREAAQLHAYPIERTIATGAPRFDEFVALSPMTDRVGFCAPLGFDPSRPILMYLGSSKFVVTESELPFMRTWVDAIRRSTNEAVRDCNILIRPHPDVKTLDEEGPTEIVRWDGQAGRGWVTRPIDLPRVAVVRTHYRKAQAFYDALYHSAAVIALNTSAALEAAIVGRPVFTILAGSGAADGQSTTLHFHYLLRQNGGCVRCASSLEEHRAQLVETLSGPDEGTRLRAFAKEFVRPGGWDVPASQLLADAIVREFASLAPARAGVASGG
jgi:hypothetical protein